MADDVLAVAVALAVVPDWLVATYAAAILLALGVLWWAR
jgi:hypothetical protein